MKYAEVRTGRGGKSTRSGDDLGCYLQWRKAGKIQQRTLADFEGGVSV